MQNKLLGQVMCRVLSGTLLLLSAPGLIAQDADQGSYQGPGIFSPGVGSIGSRSGEQVDLRYYLGFSGVVDGTNTPFAVDSNGNLVRIPYLYGVQVSGGAYGVHSWKRSQLALDYAGGYTKFLNSDAYSSANHALSIGYTDQISRRLRLDLRESLGSLTYGSDQAANAASNELNTSFTPATRVFNTRTYYLQSSASATYLQSARTSFTAGGSTSLQTLKSTGLANGWGYSLNASVIRRMSKSVSLGVTYLYSHFEYPEFSSKADSHALQALYATGLGRFWTFSIEAGATFNKGESLLITPLDAVLAAILGQPTLKGIAHFQTVYPSGTVALTRQFRRASLGFHYYRGVNSGNGAYNTGILDNATASISYTGRKVNMGADGGYYKLKSIGQDIGRFSVISAGAGITYPLGRDLHLTLRYDYRDQLIDLSTYRQKGSRASIGLNFSPGNVPLSLW